MARQPALRCAGFFAAGFLAGDFFAAGLFGAAFLATGWADAAAANAAFFEYAPRQIKLAVVGSGSAEKGQVQVMMKSMLRLEGSVAADAADALAAAVCHAVRGRLRAAILQTAGRG